jgi:hypothetical protein
MAEKLLKEVYETPRILVRGVFLCDNLMDCQSPVKRVTLEAWEPGVEQSTADGDITLALW